MYKQHNLVGTKLKGEFKSLYSPIYYITSGTANVIFTDLNNTDHVVFQIGRGSFFGISDLLRIPVSFSLFVLWDDRDMTFMAG
jgi:CRP-like cAMP-binding protein